MCTRIQRERYSLLKEKICKRYPDAKIRYKENHWLWKRLPRALRESGTTIGNTIWMPHAEDYNFEMLAHEYQHLVDFNEMGMLGFMMMYINPQAIAPFWFFIAAVAIGFQLPYFALLMASVGIIFLLPWPSRSRSFLEMRGYMMNLYIWQTYYKDDSKYMEDFVVDSIRSWLYYKMVWTRKQAQQIVQEAVRILSNRDCIPNISVAFQDVHDIID